MSVDAALATASPAIERAVGHLYDRQRDDGGWTDVLSSSPMTTALAVLALSRVDAERYRWQVEAGVAWLRRNQRDDGGWAMADTFPPSSPGTTTFVIAALQALDPVRSREAVRRATGFVEANGGFGAVPGMAGPGPKTWPAAAAIAWVLAGLRDPADQPYQPIEVMLLPPALRNKVSIGLPAVLGLGIMQRRTMPAGLVRRGLQALAEPLALRWLRAVQGPNGGIEECPLISAFVLIGLHAAGVAPDVQRGSLDYLLATQRVDGSWAVDRDLEITVTTYAVLALAELGDVAEEPRLRRTRDWLLSTQWTEPFRPLNLPAGGFSWNVPSGWPESDDTAVVLSALRELGVGATHPAVASALKWLRQRQNRDGSWSEWVRNSSFLNDRPCPGVTAHVVMALHQHGQRATRLNPLGRALRYLQRNQNTDGSSPSLWFRDSVHGTAKLLEACVVTGRARHPVARAARHWLMACQRADGAWPGGPVTGKPGATVEETAWALYALLLAGEPAGGEPMTRAARWLLEAQTDDGTWLPSPVGYYFDDLCYADDLIAHTSALRALAKWRKEMAR